MAKKISLLSKLLKGCSMSKKGECRQSKRSSRGRKMLLESLEERKVMAASIAFTAPFELSITADSRGSQVSVLDMDYYNSPSNPNDWIHVNDVSPDGNRWYTIAKNSVKNIKFTGSEYTDVLNASTGVGYNFSTLKYVVDARGGRDVITTGLYDDLINGGSGDDDVYAGGGNDTVNGGLGRDRIWGNDGSDTVRGEAGFDDLFGGAGDDTLHGGADSDLLEGESGNDHLFGDGGSDFLYGGDGEDGLYGGQGADYLHAGRGADRFIITTNETGPFWQSFIDGTTISFYGLADNIADDSVEDVRMRFTNEGARTIVWGPGVVPGTTSYTAGAWTDDEIKLFDDAFGVIADTTANNALLYKSNGGELEFFRLGNASNQYIAYNDGTGNTHYANQSFQVNGMVNDNWARQVVFHEIGHNWDSTQEADRLVKAWGPSVVSSFQGLSKWTQTAPVDVGNYFKSRDNQWWYHKDSRFVRDYGRTNPSEDYSDTFSRYFMDQAGRPFLDATFTGAPEKVDIIRFWATLVRGLGTAARPVGAGGTWGNPSAMAASAANAGNMATAVAVFPTGFDLARSTHPLVGDAVANDGLSKPNMNRGFAVTSDKYTDKKVSVDLAFAEYREEDKELNVDALAEIWLNLADEAVFS